MRDNPEEQKIHPLNLFNAEAQRLLRVLDVQLEGNAYVCGHDLTIADNAISPCIRGCKWRKVEIRLHANVLAWKELVYSRDRAMLGLAYDVKSGEVDRWSEETKKRYVAGGSFMASNKTIGGH